MSSQAQVCPPPYPLVPHQVPAEVPQSVAQHQVPLPVPPLPQQPEQQLLARRQQFPSF
jgi:hypothetical protein